MEDIDRDLRLDFKEMMQSLKKLSPYLYLVKPTLVYELPTIAEQLAEIAGTDIASSTVDEIVAKLKDLG